mmetsp:Transcript_106531/g.301279  ORF Transcript_106531/g.301279 Transcript_106531/m.301279 type:complete len:225 (-) Transcript_106531:2700-3374(-)
MVTSQHSKPASLKAAAISRSPLLPSSRMMAILGAWLLNCQQGFGLGTVACTTGVQRTAMLLCSCSTHAGLACSISSENELLSHMSRSSVIFPSNSTCPDLPTILTTSRAQGSPIFTHETPADLYSAITASTLPAATSSRRPSSSWKSAWSVVSPATSGLDTSSVSPQLPAKAISSAAPARPPSLRSWPAETSRLPISSCVTLKALFKPSATGVSQSAGTSPRCP